MKDSIFRGIIFLGVITALLVVINDIRKDPMVSSQNQKTDYGKSSQPELVITESDFD